MTFLSTSLQGTVAVVTLNRPPVNAVSQEMYAEIRDTFTRLRQTHPSACVAVLRAEGKHFCGGNDLVEFGTLSPMNSAERMQAVREAFWSIYDCPLPVVAAVRGSAMGTGLCLAASSDIVVCGESARFGLPEVSVGVMGGARHLARLVPTQVARRMFLTADPMSAAELLPYGGISRVVPDAELDACALEMAGRITRHSPAAVRIGKRALNQIEHLDLKSGYELEQGYTGDLCGHPDSEEALAAVREKRAPQYLPADAVAGQPQR